MARQTLLLLPGLLCDETVWRNQIAALGAAFDCRVANYGSLNSLGAMADHVLAQAPERFAVAGHSMGGRVALEVFRQAPERVTQIALLNTGFRPLPSGEAGREEERGRYALLAVAREQGMRAMAAKWIPPMLHPERRNDPAIVEEIAAMFARKSPAIFEAQIQALLGRPDCTDLLPRIQCPALVLTGSHDAWSSPRQHEEIAAAIPGSELAIVPDCGHMSTMERPEELTFALSEWIACAPNERIER
ncbi:MAG: alpha/beta fold hydrolase [Acidobacteriota bacterium]|nr:alpha/beta fold hydrolase [Acidobacteriota bacterium]